MCSQAGRVRRRDSLAHGQRQLHELAATLQAAQQQRKERGWTLLRAFRPEEKAKERRALQARKVILDTVQKAVDRK